MNILDIFSGIGGFSLGLESIGMRTVAFCESDGYARRILRQHWPEAWLYEDVRTLTAKRLKQDGVGPIDLICGGFPCQDISCANTNGRGIEGNQSGLWSEYARLIHEIRPHWVVAENVPALRSRGADRVLGDLEGIGYTAWPLVVGALHAGAPHRRRRTWILAHSCRSSLQSSVDRPQERLTDVRTEVREVSPAGPGWCAEPGVRRVAHGVSAQVDRLRCLGNAVVPQVVAMIGQAILDTDEAATLQAFAI